MLKFSQLRGKASTAWLFVALAFAGMLAPAPSLRAAERAQRPVSAKAQQRLERAVRRELRMLPWFSVFDHLEFRVRGYDVELFGQVTRPTLRTDAERVVERIEGVEKVTNHIEVLPLSFHDDRLRVALYRAIFSASHLSRYVLQPIPPIHIIVKNGHVTLVGVVATEAERDVATIRANGVPGVFSVTNRLRVEQARRES